MLILSIFSKNYDSVKFAKQKFNQMNYNRKLKLLNHIAR